MRGDTYFQSVQYFSNLNATVVPGTQLPAYQLVNFQVNWRQDEGGVCMKRRPLFVLGYRCAESGEIETVEVHDFGPRRHEVLHEFFLRITASIDLRDGA